MMSRKAALVSPRLFINATLAAACEFSLAPKTLNLERLKAEVSADDARLSLKDAVLNLNLVQTTCRYRGYGNRLMSAYGSV